LSHSVYKCTLWLTKTNSPVHKSLCNFKHTTSWNHRGRLWCQKRFKFLCWLPSCPSN